MARKKIEYQTEKKSFIMGSESENKFLKEMGEEGWILSCIMRPSDHPKTLSTEKFYYFHREII